MGKSLGRSPPQSGEFAGKVTFFVDLTVKVWYNIRVGSLRVDSKCC